MGYWKSKVLPKIKKVFETKGPKKTAAAEACKSFDASKVGSWFLLSILSLIFFIIYTLLLFMCFYSSFFFLLSLTQEAINKEFEEKKTELQSKVVEIYEASSTEIKVRLEKRKKRNPCCIFTHFIHISSVK